MAKDSCVYSLLKYESLLLYFQYWIVHRSKCFRKAITKLQIKIIIINIAAT